MASRDQSWGYEIESPGISELEYDCQVDMSIEVVFTLGVMNLNEFSMNW